MMKIGDTVITKKTGLPAIGVVGGIVLAKTLFKTAGVPEGYENTWDELYPDWQEKELVFVEFKEPQKIMSFAEWKENVSSPEYATREVYDKVIPSMEASMYPIDDLEQW